MKILAWPSTASGNPYINLLYGSLIRVAPNCEIREYQPRRLLALRETADICHMHWPEDVLTAPSRLRLCYNIFACVVAISAAKLRGVRLVWTIHNLEAHEQRWPILGVSFRRWFTSMLDATIVLTEGGGVLARQRYPALRNKPMAVIPHGHYMGAYPNSVDQTTARGRLGLTQDDRVVLFLGRIRDYKNVAFLIRQFRRLQEGNLRLVVAGEPHTMDLRSDLEVAAGDDSRIQLCLHFIDDQDVQIYMKAADLVVLPYSKVLNSGSVFLALSFGRPVLVPGTPIMKEIQNLVGDAFLMTYSATLTPAGLRDALHHACDQVRDEAVLYDLLAASVDWDGIGTKTMAFFQNIVGERGQQGSSAVSADQLAGPKKPSV